MIQPVEKKQQSRKSKNEPLFIRRARRAMIRAAKNVAIENKRLGLPLIASKIDE